MRTVNVIEIPDTNNMSIAQLVSFEDSPEGNVLAEAYFKKLVLQLKNDSLKYPSSKQISKSSCNKHPLPYICIVHSTPPEV